MRKNTWRNWLQLTRWWKRALLDPQQMRQVPWSAVSYRPYGSERKRRKNLKELLAEKIPKERERMAAFREKFSDKSLGEIKLSNVMGGLRGLNLLWCDTSYVDPEYGLSYRNVLLKDVVSKLPAHKGSEIAKPESVFWLLTAGQAPVKSEADWVTCQWHQRGEVPSYALKVIDSMDQTIHPMAQLCAAVACLDPSSEFTKAYHKRVPKTRYWEYVYEDSMNLCAYLPTIAAAIYTNVFRGGKGTRERDEELDWTGNYANMIGFRGNNKLMELLRLYFILHADHDGGNVSAHTMQLVGSALTNPYLSYVASMAGLAGPLHGNANQEVMMWLDTLKKRIGSEPTDDKLMDYLQKELDDGKALPGYGHAVLRNVDPRFVLFNEFGQKYCPKDKNVMLVTRLSKLAPVALKNLGKVTNPNPNVDAHSGVLLHHFGLTEQAYYTVLFGMSRALGALAQTIWMRALGAPIERPKSFTSAYLCNYLKVKALREACKKISEQDRIATEKAKKLKEEEIQRKAMVSRAKKRPKHNRMEQGGDGDVKECNKSEKSIKNMKMQCIVGKKVRSKEGKREDTGEKKDGDKPGKEGKKKGSSCDDWKKDGKQGDKKGGKRGGKDAGKKKNGGKRGKGGKKPGSDYGSKCSKKSGKQEYKKGGKKGSMSGTEGCENEKVKNGDEKNGKKDKKC